MNSFALFLACAGACVVIPVAALAAPSPADSARADTLFREGVRLFEGGQTVKACAKFDESYQIDPALGTLQNLALCHEKEGKLVLAYDELTRLSAKAREAGKTQRADFARDHLAALDTKVARVVLAVPDGVPITALEVDGAARDWREPIALDAGHHVITAHADGRPDARVEVDVPAAGGSQSVPVTFPLAQPAPAPASPPVQPAPAAPPLDASPSPPAAVFWGLAGVGAAGVLAGSIFGVLTFTQKSSGDSHCAGMYCDASGLSSESSAHTSATISTVAFAVGLAALAVDAVLVLTRPHAPRPAAGNLNVTGRPGSASLALSF
jgi:hypothetical protein